VSCSRPGTVDVAVVGGGIAGVTIASELTATHSVALLEQEDHLAHHATGRSAAAFLESYGSPEVCALTRASRPVLEAADAPTPLLTARHLLWIAGPGRHHALEGLLARQPGLRAVTAARTRTLCPALRADHVDAAAVEEDAADIDVAAMHQMYVRRARSLGCAVVTGARLVGAVRDRGRWRLQHAAGGLVAGLVVNAAGAWADRVATLLGARPCGLRPLRRTIAIGRTARPLARTSPLVADVDEHFYFRPEGPHVLVSPADETPSEPCDVRPDEADVALALERVNEATTLGIRSVVAAWAGLRTFAPDRNPVVGFDPEVPGLFWLACQGGYGIQMAPALARLAAALVRGQPCPVPGVDLAKLSPTRFRP
jgi:D-arginine dehydrogenase